MVAGLNNAIRWGEEGGALGDMRMADAMEFKDAKKSDIADSSAVQKELAKDLKANVKPPGAT